MSFYKLFKKNSLQGSAPATLVTSNEYIFSVCWATPGSLVLYMLVGKLNGGPSTQIITHTVADTDGEISVKIGEFEKGKQLAISFGVEAITDLAKVAVYVTNKTTNQVVKMKPALDQFKALGAAETWLEEIKFDTF